MSIIQFFFAFLDSDPGKVTQELISLLTENRN